MNQAHYLKEFIRYTFLNIMGMMALSFYILADTLFVAQGVGVTGLTALNLAIPVYNLVNGCGLMLGMGGAIKYTIYKSQNKADAQNSIFSNTLLIAALLAAVFFLSGLFLSGPIASVLGADAITFDMTHTYLKVILLFSPAFMLSNILNAFVRNDGNPKLSMIATTSGCLGNVVLDYLLIFPMHMGILGAVLATGMSPIINMIILSSHFRKGHSGFHPVRMLPKMKLTFSSIALGLPSLITEVSSGIVIIVFNLIILKLTGNTGVAAYSVIANLSFVVIAIFTGIAQGMQPLVSRSYGSNDTFGIEKIRRYALILMLILSAAVYLTVFILADPIAAAFNSEHNAQLQQIASVGLKLYFIATPFMGFNIIASVFLAATEKPMPAQVISLLRGFFLIIPITLLLASLFGMTGIWISCPAAEALVTLIALIIFSKF